jgi:hypothetical protein
MTIMVTTIAKDTVAATTKIMTVTSTTGTALTTIVCLRVWPSAIVFLPD